MMRLVKMIIVAISFFLTIINHIGSCWAQLGRENPNDVFGVNLNVSYPKIYYYDTGGILHLNGSFPGRSTPIVLDYKVYLETCTSNVYFSFTYVPKKNIYGAWEVCSPGMTICYESQLDNEEIVLPEYRVSNRENNPVAMKCMHLNKGNRRAHGFNIALKKRKNSYGKQIEFFYELTLSFMDGSYKFDMPEDGVITLQVGGPKTLMSRLVNTKGEDVKPIGIEFGGEIIGDDFGEAPDTENNERFSNVPGLWILYMDFKRPHYQMQIIQAIHEHDDNSKSCQMDTIVRGNKMLRCRSWMEDLAITEPVNTNLTFVYTMETGVIRRQEQGQENFSELKTKIAINKLTKRIEKMINDQLDKSSNSTSDSSSHQKIDSKANKHSHKVYGDATAKMDGKTADEKHSGGGGLNAHGHYEKGEDAKKENKGSKGSSKSETESMYKEVKKSKSLMEAFGKTSGKAETLSQSKMMSSSNAFSSREAVDVEVNLPPNKRVVLQQLMFECDGNVIKMPHIGFKDEENLFPANVTKTSGKKKSLQLEPDLTPNKESAEKLKKKWEQEQKQLEEEKKKQEAKAAKEAAKNKKGNAKMNNGNVTNRTFKNIVLNNVINGTKKGNEELQTKNVSNTNNNNTDFEVNNAKSLVDVSLDEIVSMAKNHKKEL